MKVLKRALVALCSAVLGCCFFVGCLSTTIEVEYVVDGEVYRVQEYEMNDKISLPTAPAKEGHTFIGWYTDEALTTPYTEGEITVGLTLYAKFSASKVYIVVNTDGGNEIDPIEVTPGGDYTVPAAEKEGYTFTGYTYIDENLAEQDFPLSGKFPSANSIRITAKYTVNKYNVTFVDGGETNVEVEHGQKVTAPAAQKAGYTFDGWYTSETEQTDATKFDFKTAITDELTLYAKYTANSYKITINENGGTFANASDKTVTVSYNGAYTLATPTKVGYTFAGYTVDGDTFETSGTYTRIGDVRIVANWTINKYTVTFKDFDTDAVISTQENVEHGTYATAPANEAGYDKTLYKEDKTTVFNAKTEEIVDNTVVYVKKEAKTFTITVNNVPQGYVNPTAKYQGAYTLDTTALEGITGWDFVGFEKDGQPFEATGTYTWTEDITVTAKWNTIYAPIYFYDGTTALNSLSILDQQEGVDLSSVSFPAVPDKTGYDKATVWYTDEACTQEFVAEGTLAAEGLTLYAKYTAKTYKITISNNVDNSERFVDVKYGEVPALGTPAKTGYAFVKYTYDDADFDEDAVYSYAHNITIKEEFKEVPQYVTFVYDNGAEDVAVKVLNGLTVSKPADPSKTGYTFAGWYANEACTTAYDFNAAVTSDIEVFAKWTANTYKVIFSVWDSATKTMKNVEATATYGQPLTDILPARATREAYEANGYTVNGVAFDVNAAFVYTETITIVEQWSLKEGEKLLQYDDEANFFKERETYDDPWTFVYLAGENYEFNDNATLVLTSMGADAYASVSGNVLKVKAVGTFEFTLNGVARKAKAVEYVQSFGLGGTNYDNAWGLDASGEYKRYAQDKLTEALSDDVWNKRVAVSAGEAMKVGKVNFIPEVSINGSVKSINAADVVVSATCEGKALGAGEYTVKDGAITFADALVGKMVSVTVTPKYAVDVDHVVTYNVLVNNGVNVYTNDELKAAYSNTSVGEINLLRNIKVELSDDQVNTFTVDGWTIKSPKNGSDENGGTGVYERWTGDLKINGNYFTVDGSGIPIIDGRDGMSQGYPDGTREPNDVGANVLQNVQFSIFSFGKRGQLTNPNYDVLTMDNVNIIGNGEMNSTATGGYQINGKEILKYSGGCIGIQVGGGTLKLNNVTSRFGAFAVNAYGSDPILKEGSSTEYTHMCVIEATDCNFSNNWSNNIYVWGFGAVTLDSSYVGAANGAAVHFDALGSPNGADCEFNLINDSVVENWVVGSEAWFVAYDAVVAVNDIKTNVENAVGGASQVVSALSGANVNKTVTKGETVNFVMLMVQRGDEWTTDNNPDPNASIKLNFNVFDVNTAGYWLQKYQNGQITTADDQTSLGNACAPVATSNYAKFGAASGAIGDLGNLIGLVEIINK